MKTSIHFVLYLTQFFSEREMFQTKVVQKIKTRIPPLPPKKTRAVYEVMVNNVRQVTDDNIIRHMRTACWIPKA